MTLYLGDCLDILREMPANSIDALVTDPPAGIGFMGKEWDHDKGGRDAWVSWLSGVMSECLRVLKPGAHALVWALPRTSHWTGWALEEAGFEVRDRIAHLFGSGFPKSLDVSKAIDKMAGAEREVVGIRESLGYDGGIAIERNRKGTQGTAIGIEVAPGGVPITVPATPAAVQWQGWGTALKPACEDWWLCRKPLAEGTVAANVLEWGVGAINIDATRIPTNGDDAKAMERCNTPGSGRMYASRSPIGAFGRSNPTGPLDTSQGRFPANVTHDGSEEVLAGFPMTTSGDKLPHHKRTTPKGKNTWAAGIGGGLLHAPENGENYPGDSGSAARFFYCAKASRQDREEGCEGLEEALRRTHGDTGPCDNAKPNGQGPISCRNHHPTVKPTPLMRWLCRLITPPGGTVLDPFMGSGSTGKAVALEGFGFIGIELDPEYFEIAKRRIEHVQHQPQMVMEL